MFSKLLEIPGGGFNTLEVLNNRGDVVLRDMVCGHGEDGLGWDYSLSYMAESKQVKVREEQKIYQR